MVFTQSRGFVAGASFGLPRPSLRCRVLVCHAADTASLATLFLFGKLFGVATLFDFGEKRCRKNLPLADASRLIRPDDNPFVPPVADSTHTRVGSPNRFVACAIFWCFGVLLLSLTFAFDAATSSSVPGGVLYVVLILSPCITFVASALSPVSGGLRLIAFFASLILMAIQFVVLGVLSFASTGMEGVH